MNIAAYICMSENDFYLLKKFKILMKYEGGSVHEDYNLERDIIKSYNIFDEKYSPFVAMVKKVQYPMSQEDLLNSVLFWAYKNVSNISMFLEDRFYVVKLEMEPYNCCLYHHSEREGLTIREEEYIEGNFDLKDIKGEVSIIFPCITINMIKEVYYFTRIEIKLVDNSDEEKGSHLDVKLRSVDYYKNLPMTFRSLVYNIKPFFKTDLLSKEMTSVIGMFREGG